MIRKMAIIYGLGGSLFDPANGEVLLLRRFKEIGLTVPDTPFQYDDSRGIHNFLHGPADWRGIVGDSFGADFGPKYAGDLAPTKVDFLGGFQPSMFANDVRNGQIIVPKNVVVAHCIRDPNWADTGGLGFATWVVEDPRATKLLVTEHRGAHPDDWGFSQDLIFNQVKGLIS